MPYLEVETSARESYDYTKTYKKKLAFNLYYFSCLMQLGVIDDKSQDASHLIVDSELKLSTFFGALVQKGSLENIKIISKDVKFFRKGTEIGINQDFSGYITRLNDEQNHPQLGWSSAMIDVCCTFSKIRDGIDGILGNMRDMSLISVTFSSRNSKDDREVDAGEGFQKEVPLLKRDGVLFDMETMFRNHGFEFTMTPFRWELHKSMTHVIYRLSRSTIAHQAEGSKWLRHVEPYSFNGTIFDFFEPNLKRRLSKSQYEMLSEKFFPPLRTYLLESNKDLPDQLQFKTVKRSTLKRQRITTQKTVDTGEDLVSGRIYEMMFMTDAVDTRERVIIKINSIREPSIYFEYFGKDPDEYIVSDDEVKFFSYTGNVTKEKYHLKEIVLSRFDEEDHETWFYATIQKILPGNQYQIIYNGYESYKTYDVNWSHLKKVQT